MKRHPSRQQETTPPSPPMTAIEIETALKARYPKDEYAYFSQVRNCTGFGRQIRTADVLVLSLWPSRGLQLHGFELKISKSDWKRELDTPAKADELVQFCDAWWIVAPAGIVDHADLPPTWGLLEWTGDKWKTTTPRRPLKPRPLTREFVASLVRTFAREMVPASQVETMVTAQLAAAVTQETKRLQNLEQEYRRFKERVAAFEAASGISVSQPWQDGADIGRAVKAVLRGEHKVVPDQLRSLRDSAAGILSHIDQVLGDLAAKKILTQNMPQDTSEPSCPA